MEISTKKDIATEMVTILLKSSVPQSDNRGAGITHEATVCKSFTVDENTRLQVIAESTNLLLIAKLCKVLQDCTTQLLSLWTIRLCFLCKRCLHDQQHRCQHCHYKIGFEQGHNTVLSFYPDYISHICRKMLSFLAVLVLSTLAVKAAVVISNSYFLFTASSIFKP